MYDNDFTIPWDPKVKKPKFKYEDALSLYIAGYRLQKIAYYMGYTYGTLRGKPFYHTPDKFYWWPTLKTAETFQADVRAYAKELGLKHYGLRGCISTFDKTSPSPAQYYMWRQCGANWYMLKKVRVTLPNMPNPYNQSHRTKELIKALIGTHINRLMLFGSKPDYSNIYSGKKDALSLILGLDERLILGKLK